MKTLAFSNHSDWTQSLPKTPILTQSVIGPNRGIKPQSFPNQWFDPIAAWNPSLCPITDWTQSLLKPQSFPNHLLGAITKLEPNLPIIGQSMIRNDWPIGDLNDWDWPPIPIWSGSDWIGPITKILGGDWDWPPIIFLAPITYTGGNPDQSLENFAPSGLQHPLD